MPRRITQGWQPIEVSLREDTEWHFVEAGETQRKLGIGELQGCAAWIQLSSCDRLRPNMWAELCIRRRLIVEVSGWKNGKFSAGRSVSLGVSVGRVNVQQFFDKKWGAILIKLGETTVQVKLTRRFWTTCPELRSSAIGDWMRRNGLVPWLKGKPPKMSLTPEGGIRFRLSL